jgi:trehalose 6-phosphate phosphatase
VPARNSGLAADFLQLPAVLHLMSTDRAETRAAWPPMPAAPALFLDIDGTLLDIAESPDRVVVPTSLVGDLQRASAALGGALALISGRAIETIDRLFEPLRLPAAGQHGLQLRYAPNAPVVIVKCVDLSALRQQIMPVTGIPGIQIEDKGQSIAIHYRRARTDVLRLQRWVADVVARTDAEMEIIRGRRVIEIKPAGVNKATAVGNFMELPPFSGRRPVFIGDDKTDEDGFKATLARGGLAIQVGPGRSALTTLCVGNPAAVRCWLNALPSLLARDAADD